MAIHFFEEDIRFSLEGPEKRSEWLFGLISAESRTPGDLNIIFCSDEYLLKMNREHLQHDYYTDIITFDYSKDGVISGDLFISLDRVTENSENAGGLLEDELDRVMAHGILHLLGYNDKTENESREIQKKEDHYLSLRAF